MDIPATTGRILVVDDQPANLRAVSTLLSRQGYEAMTTGNGDDALAQAAAQTPDLILLDMLMPGMDGFELLASLKKRKDLLQVPVIFLTAAQDRDLLLRAFDAGAVDYVTKPFIPEELLARVAAHIGLKLARDRLESVANERQELVNLVAHDLKNPLSSVLFATDMLRNNACAPERIPRYLDIIHDSVGDALGYIRRYLELQAQAHHTPGPCQDSRALACDLRDTLQWLGQRYQMQLEARAMHLDIRAPGERICVAIDGRVLRQVAENLISNAIKYAPGSPIEVSVRDGSTGFRQMLVEDRGPGIVLARQHQLFQPFARLSDNLDDNASSGLGLSLAKRILENYGGTLSYEDREGGGARFVVEVPIADNS